MSWLRMLAYLMVVFGIASWPLGSEASSSQCAVGIVCEFDGSRVHCPANIEFVIPSGNTIPAPVRSGCVEIPAEVPRGVPVDIGIRLNGRDVRFCSRILTAGFRGRWVVRILTKAFHDAGETLPLPGGFVLKERWQLETDPENGLGTYENVYIPENAIDGAPCPR